MHIRLNPPPGRNLKTTPFRTSIKVGGGAVHGVEIDTGSPAIILPKSKIGKEATLLAEKQSYGYVSSGNTYLGDWVLAKVEVNLDPRHGKPTVATSRAAIPVYGVTHTCKGAPAAPDYANCTPLSANQPSHIGMLGISYKPFKVPVTVPNVDAGKLPSANLFLNLGSQTPGYIITADSIQVGLNQTNTQNFKTLPMVKTASGNVSPQTCITYETQKRTDKPLCGATLLMDTGINHFYLTMPAQYCPANSTGGKAPTGATFTLSAPDTNNPVLAFSFKVDDPSSSPMLPAYVNCATDTQASTSEPSSAFFHVNTGRMVLAGMDYMYRASDNLACHVIGFRPTTAKHAGRPRQ